MPEFSVIIPTFGRPAFLSEAVDSVLKQTLGDFECLVVDDSSPQAPRIPDDPRIRLLRRPKNGGPAAARNTGIAEATGRYIAFLDDDDVWLPTRLTNAFAAHRRAPVVSCWQSTVGSTGVPGGRMLEGDVGDSILDGMTPHLGATSMERAITPTFDERYEASEDVEWWLRVAQSSPAATTATVDFLYRAHGAPRTRTGQSNRVRDGLLLLEQHEEWFRAHPRAKAFRLKRIGLSALTIGDRRLALRCFAQSFRLAPEPRTAWHAFRTLSQPLSGGRVKKV
jgi:glycosyltransferase involved in cell wall biosynthesis